MENRIDEIRNLIGDVEFLAAINEVIELTTSLGHKDLRDDAFLLKSNQVQLNQDRNKGLGSSDEFAGRQNIIVDKVLDLLSDLETRVATKPEPPKKELVVEPISQPKTRTVTVSNNNLPKIIIAVVAGLLIMFFGYRFIKSASKKAEKETVVKVDTCEEALNRIEEAIAAKEFLIAKKGLFKADKICTEKIRLTLLFEDYNEALETAKQSGEPIKVTEEEPNKPTETDNGTKPDGGIKPEIVKPGVITIDPSRLMIKPGVLNLDTWTGTWSSDFGEMLFIQNGNEIIGDYIKYNGWLKGKYDSSSKSWKGTFYNGISKKYGKFEFVKNGKKFSGTWRFDDNSSKGNWGGNQISTTLPTLKIFPKEKRR